MGNVIANHSNIERNIGGGSARNFNQKKVFGEGLTNNFNQKKVFGEGLASNFNQEKVFGEGLANNFNQKKYSAKGSPNTFDTGKAAKRDSPAYKISFEEWRLWTCGVLKISTAMKMLFMQAFSVQMSLFVHTLLLVLGFADVFFRAT